MAQFTNFATLSYNGLTLTSNTVTGELLETVSISKTSTSETYGTEDDLTYIVNLVNSGSNQVCGLRVTDDLGAYEFGGETVYPLRYREGSLRFFVDGVLQSTPKVCSLEPLVISDVCIPACGNATLVYDTETTPYAPLDADSTITNTACVTGGCLAAPVCASETLCAAEGPELQISKALAPAAVSVGGTLTYTFLIENCGNTPVTAADSVTLSDTFDPVLCALSVSYNGAPWSAPVNYSYDQASGVFTTVPGAITVPAATYSQGPNGAWSVTPGTATLSITGTVKGA